VNWIAELSIERMTQYSNGIIVQTDDCKRISEFISKMKESYPTPIVMKIRSNGSWIKERYFVVDGWEGFQEYKHVNNKWNLETIADAKQYGGQPKNLLPVIGKELEKGNAVVLIQNLLKTDDYLNNAIRSWSTSEILRRKNSTIILFVEDMTIFPESVWSKMKTIDVPKSTDDERRQIILEQQKGLGLPRSVLLSDAELNAAIRVCAGMNLDQVDAAVAESLIRHTRINIEALDRTKTALLGKNPALEIIQRPKFGFEAIGGYDTLKQRIKDEVILPLQKPEIAEQFNIDPPRGMILFGPPGTGKTVLSKAMSKELNMSILVLRPENFMSKYVGESEKSLKNIFKIADAMSPTILFTDELDRIGKRSQMSGSDGGSQVRREIFSMFLEKLGDENRRWFFVGCTNRIEDIDEAFRRTGRIDTLAPVPLPNEKAKEKIFEIHSVIKRHLPLADDVKFKELSKNTYTYMWSGSDVEQLIIRTAKYVMKDSIKKDKTRKITMGDFKEILETFNVDTQSNERMQEHIKEQASRLTNDRRLMDIFEEAQVVEEGSRAEKAKEVMCSLDSMNEGD